MELIAIIVFLGFCFYISHINEWRSDNRMSPDGYHTDWLQASEDIRKHGKQYYYEQNLKGKYDVKDK